VDNKSTQLVVPYTTVAEIRRELPTIDLQFDYQRKIAALKKYAKTKELAIAEIEAQVAMAQTIPEALKRGDITTQGDHTKRRYQVGNATLAGAEVNRWRQVSKIPAKSRREFYDDRPMPKRSALLKWWEASKKTEEVLKKMPAKTDAWTITGSQKVVRCHALITDPPYGILDEDWEPSKIRNFTVEWATRWN